MKYKYGEVIITTKNIDDLQEKIEECKDLGYKLGDKPLEKIDSETSYRLIVNSDNYIDVEYLVRVEEYTTITLSEYKSGLDSSLIKGV
jgi:hypothetical protein